MNRAGVCALLLAVAAGGVLAGCRNSSRAPGPNPDGLRQGEQGYLVRGTVVGSDPARGELTLKSGASPGAMQATTSYRLEDAAALSELHPGDAITATVVKGHSPQGAENLRLRDIVIVGQAQADYKPTVQYHVPAQGDSVPNFTLLNQSGRTIDLKQFRGRVLVLTFIYTRCPLADYCVRMSHNFAQIDKALEADPRLYRETHLLSVSFDPSYDTPKVLKSYGEAYTGRYVKETFQHWDFGAPRLAELPAIEHYFDVGVTPARNGTLQHSLSTVVIGKDGKIVAFWPTNDWTVADVMTKIRSAAGIRWMTAVVDGGLVLHGRCVPKVNGQCD